MNDRIREITGQVLDELVPETWTALGYDKIKEIQRRTAELIVQECVQTLIDNAPERYTNESAEEDWDKGYDRAMRDCVHHIQEHFGVEE